MMRPPRARSLALICLLLSLSSVAWAAEGGASRLFDRAKRHYDHGRFEGSLRLLRRAGQRAKTPKLQSKIHLYLGLNLILLGKTTEADREFTLALAADPTAELDRAKFKRAIVARFQRVREGLSGFIEVQVDQPGAQIKIDAQAAGAAPAKKKVSIGRHLVVVRLGDTSKRRQVVVHPNQTAVARFVLPAQIQLPKAMVKDQTTASGSRGKRIWTWIAAGGSVACALVGVGLGVSAKSDYDAYQKTEDPATFDNLAGRIPGKATGANVMFGLAGAFAAGSILLYLIEGRERPRENRRNTAVLPLIGPIAGVGIQRRF